MSPLQAAVLGVIQGLTEFLPVSSSAHLYVIPTLLGWHYAGVAFDVALHWGTLLALLFALGGTWVSLFRDAFVGTQGRRATAWSTLFKLAVASIPAAVAGFLLQDAAEHLLRNLGLQAFMLVVFGFLLWWVDRAQSTRQDTIDTPLQMPGFGACLVVGCAQALALVPGVSRSGVTITAARAIGVPRVSAARLSFLLATPITFGAGLLELRHLPKELPVTALLVGVLTAAVTGVIAIRGLLAWLQRAGFAGFFAYRVLVALGIVVFMLTR
jgi:undecaprenyl-diphosphatase